MGSSEPPNSDYDDLYNVQITSPLVYWDCSLLYKKFSLYDFPPVVLRTHYGRSRIVAFNLPF